MCDPIWITAVNLTRWIESTTEVDYALIDPCVVVISRRQVAGVREMAWTEDKTKALLAHLGRREDTESAGRPKKKVVFNRIAAELCRRFTYVATMQSQD